MRCPHCQAQPPRDPFVCATCGDRLLTYLGEPLGPDTGVPAEEPAVRAASHHQRVGASVVDRAPTDDRSWIERQIDPMASERRPLPARPVAPDPDEPADVSGSGGSVVGKLLFGLAVVLVMLMLAP